MKLEKETIITDVKRNVIYFTLICDSILNEEEYEKFCDFMNKKVKLTLETQKQILDKAEKEYLSNVIRPFRDRVCDIEKVITDYGSTETICIYYDGNKVIDLPSFKKGTMYKGMELNKEYELEDLGL